MKIGNNLSLSLKKCFSEVLWMATFNCLFQTARGWKLRENKKIWRVQQMPDILIKNVLHINRKTFHWRIIFFLLQVVLKLNHNLNFACKFNSLDKVLSKKVTRRWKLVYRLSFYLFIYIYLFFKFCFYSFLLGIVQS